MAVLEFETKSIQTITECARKCDYSYDLNIRQGRCSNAKSVANNNVSCIPTIIFSSLFIRSLPSLRPNEGAKTFDEVVVYLDA